MTFPVSFSSFNFDFFFDSTIVTWRRLWSPSPLEPPSTFPSFPFDPNGEEDDEGFLCWLWLSSRFLTNRGISVPAPEAPVKRLVTKTFLPLPPMPPPPPTAPSSFKGGILRTYLYAKVQVADGTCLYQHINNGGGGFYATFRINWLKIQAGELSVGQVQQFIDASDRVLHSGLWRSKYGTKYEKKWTIFLPKQLYKAKY